MSEPSITISGDHFITVAALACLGCTSDEIASLYRDAAAQGLSLEELAHRRLTDRHPPQPPDPLQSLDL